MKSSSFASRRVAIFGALLVLATAGCGANSPPPPGYNGPVPGAKGQFALSELAGKTLVDTTGAFGGGEWTVGPFGVVPNPLSEKGPVVRLTRGADERWVPIETDGDVADLVLRVTGERSAFVDGKTSVAYRNVMKIPE
jgi:hypothetical protein